MKFVFERRADANSPAHVLRGRARRARPPNTHKHTLSLADWDTRTRKYYVINILIYRYR